MPTKRKPIPKRGRTQQQPRTIGKGGRGFQSELWKKSVYRLPVKKKRTR